MFDKLLKFNNSKMAWVILLLGNMVLLTCSLSFQHLLELEPCVLCIYQRIGTMTMILVSALPLLFGLKNQVIRYISYTMWITSSAGGLWAASMQWYESHMAATNPFFMSQCGQGLEQYFPQIEQSEFLSNIFIARGICSEIDWSFLGLGMHHYMTVTFGILLLLGILFTVVNTVGLIKNDK